jgi:hypothetical protein
VSAPEGPVFCAVAARKYASVLEQDGALSLQLEKDEKAYDSLYELLHD